MVLDNQARSAIKKLLDIHRWSEYGICQKARKSTDDDESQKMFVETSRRGRRYL